jgi:preprotein translocase subunit SecG
MWSTLLISLDILVCIALIFVVLMQRSEGGAFGMGGGPTGLVTARGAGDLLTRITWSLFAAFLTISLTLTLIGAHDRSTSSIIEKLKLQHANPNALNQPLTPPAPTPGAPVGPTPVGPTPGSLVGAPPQAPLTAPQPIALPPQSALTPSAPAKPKRTAAAPAAASSQAAPAAPVLEAPAPKPEPAKPASDAPASGAP